MRTDLPEAVLFDLDGTLADTAPDLGAVANQLRIEAGLAPLPLIALRPHASSGVRGMLGLAFGLQPGDPDYDRYSERFLAHYEKRLCVDTRLFDEVLDLLDALEERGIKWGIVTNKRSRYTNPLVSELGLADRAACIVSGDSTPNPKPAPDALHLACEISSVRPARCIYVGDDLRDIVAGRSAGMRTVAAAYGYLGQSVAVNDWNADAIINRPAELLGLLAVDSC